MNDLSQSALTTLRDRALRRSADFAVAPAENARAGLPPLPRRTTRPEGVVFEAPLSAGDVWQPSQELQVVHSRDDSDTDAAAADEARAQRGRFARPEETGLAPDRSDEPLPDDVDEARSPLAPLMRMPYLRRAREGWVTTSFLAIVALPVILATLYFAFLAKPQYVAEFRFSVTEQTPALPGAQAPPSNGLSGGGGAAAALATVAAGIGGGSVSTGTMQNYIVVDFVKSREAVEGLQKKLKLKSLMSKGDILYRVDPDIPTESFMAHWKNIVEADYDQVTGLALVRVRAFAPEDALNIATSLMHMSEKLVNDMANRANEDSVKFAEEQVKRAEARVGDAAKALAEFRKTDNVIDPNSSAVQTNNNLVMAQRQTLLQLQTELASLERQSLARNSPVAANLAARIAAGRGELERLQNEFREQGGGRGALAGLVGRYEQLDLERQYANTAYMSALFARDQARANAAAQHIYLTPYAKPFLPEESTYPKPFRSLLLIFGAAMFLWLIGLLIVRTVQDHRL